MDSNRVARAGHTYHERWAARRALQLVFPEDDLFAIVVEGLSPNESLEFDKAVDEIADLTLFYGTGDTFKTCSAQQVLQFKYKAAAKPVTSSYLKKTIRKFSVALREFKEQVSIEEVRNKLSFAFVTNAEFTVNLLDAISCLKSGNTPQSQGARRQLGYLHGWCNEEGIRAEELFSLIEFRTSTSNLPAQNSKLRRTISDWSAGSSGHAARRLFELAGLVRDKAQIAGQRDNRIKRQDVLNVLGCDEDDLFPANARFVDTGDVVEREALRDVKDKVATCNLPVLLHADGGVGKTVFVRSLAKQLSDVFAVVVFDCFGGGAYRSEDQARHLPESGLLQVVNELAARGLCDPLLPNDSDQYGLIRVARKRLRQASETVQRQSALRGVLVVLDAADNAQLAAEERGEDAFPRLLLASLGSEPIDGVKLLLTARSHRIADVIGNSQAECFQLEPFSEEETRIFLETRRTNISEVDFSTAFARSRGNARILDYLVESWDTNVSGNAPKTEISVDELIEQRCERIFRTLETAGWSDADIREFFVALSLLPPPIPLSELAGALGWPESQVNSAASDLAPMLELVRHGAIFRDEPAETYVKDRFASERAARQSIAQRLEDRQRESIYAAEALPHFLVVIGDGNRAYRLAGSDDFPDVMESEHGRRRIRLARLLAAFSLATREKNLDRALSLTMQLSQVASANARGDQFIRRSPALAAILGDADASRRLFNDRSGWRGARDARLAVAHCFSEEFDEARIHQHRAIGWINWHDRNDKDSQQNDHSGPEAFDFAAAMLLSVLEGENSVLDRNVPRWHLDFALSVIDELILLCAQHEEAKGSEALQSLARFAASEDCLSLALQVGLLSRECSVSRDTLKAVSRAASALSQRDQERTSERNYYHEMDPQYATASAAMVSLFVNSRQSAKRLLKLCRHRRPSRQDYGDRHGMDWVWVRVQSACVAAWASGEPLSFHHLVPEEIRNRRKTRSVHNEAEMKAFLDSLTVAKGQGGRRRGVSQKRRKQFLPHEQDDIVNGAACVLQLAKPIEAALLSKHAVSNGVLADFLTTWNSVLRPGRHWRSETGRDNVARHVGMGLVEILLRHCERVERQEAEELIRIIGANRFYLGDKLRVLALLARHPNLADVAGAYAGSVSSDILRDDNVEGRGTSYRDLAGSLIPMSIQEARAYYSEGLAQLDQMGGEDLDLIYSTLHFAAEQPGGCVKPELSHRLMHLCQTICQSEPSRFQWTLFGRAASSSIGVPAMYKLVRWHDQDVASYSYGLPQVACYLAKAGRLDARRAAVLLAICKDHGWHQWHVGDGLRDLLSVARPEDRDAIFSLVAGKLVVEHSHGGWERVWESLLGCVDEFDEIDEAGWKDRLQRLRDAAQRQREIENARSDYSGSGTDFSLHPGTNERGDQSGEEVFAAILANCDPTSASSLDEAIRKIQASDRLEFGHRRRLFDEMRQTCSYKERVKFIEALCESTELTFESALDLMIECVEAWRATTVHVGSDVCGPVKALFEFKGSELFDLRYSGISRQIDRLSKLCGDSRFVLQTVLETIARERLELEGEEWLQISTSLTCQADPSTALGAFESLLSGPAAKVGDEIGEGQYQAAFAGNESEGEALADIIWHLLGDSDAFVRWSAARGLKGMLEVGLTEDVGRLLDRFDLEDCASLASDGHHFAFMNSQQWFLMGLARAAVHQGKRLGSLKPRLEALARRSDLHLVNKLHLARCLRHIECGKSMSPELAALWAEIDAPTCDAAERDVTSFSEGRGEDFGFDYEFHKYKVPRLARLFGISDGDAGGCIAEEVIKRWPGTKGMSDFPGKTRYRQGFDDGYETYREHIQRHALLFAATTLVKSRPVVHPGYDWTEVTPWQDFLRDWDVSFDDGSWLSDHKDHVPTQAREYLLCQRKGDQESLVERSALFRTVGFPEDSGTSFVPLYGHWKSTDGVYVRFLSALTKEWGAVGRCAKFSKARDPDLWLPMLGSDGRVDVHRRKSPYEALVWEPERYRIGIDESDKWAARGAIARPRLGLALTTALGLSSDKDEKDWRDGKGALALRSEVWGELTPDPDAHGRMSPDEGAILWAEREWLDGMLRSCGQSLIYEFAFRKYKPSRDYDKSSGVRGFYVGLKRSGEAARFWFAKKASETVY